MLESNILGFLAVAALVLGGIGAILGGLSVVLHAIAARTKTTVDDAIADDVDRAHARIDELTALVRSISSKPAETMPVKAGGPPSSSAPVVAMLALLLGLGALTSESACATARPAVATGVVAAFDCEAAHLDAAALGDARAFADAEVQRWIGGAAPSDLDGLRAKIKADLAPIKSDLGHCAIGGALAAVLALANPTPATAELGLTAASTTSASGPDPAQLRAAFAGAARELGWAPVRVASGITL